MKSKIKYTLNRRSSGFTLVELMIVVAIVAVLATVAGIAYVRHLKSGRVVNARTFLATIQARQAVYFQQHGQYCNASGQTATATAFRPALSAGEPKSKPWDPTTFGGGTITQGWQDLGARPESDRTYASFFVLASIPPNHALDGGIAAAAGIPIQPVDPNASKHPWFYAVAHLDLDGKATYNNGGCSPKAEILTVGNCTVMYTSSAQASIRVVNEGQ